MVTWYDECDSLTSAINAACWFYVHICDYSLNAYGCKLVQGSIASCPEFIFVIAPVDQCLGFSVDLFEKVVKSLARILVASAKNLTEQVDTKGTSYSKPVGSPAHGDYTRYDPYFLLRITKLLLKFAKCSQKVCVS